MTDRVWNNYLTPRLICAIIKDGLNEGMGLAAERYGVYPPTLAEFLDREFNLNGRDSFVEKSQDIEGTDRSHWLAALGLMSLRC